MVASSTTVNGANPERAKLPNPYAQPFALTNHYKSVRSNGETDGSSQKEDFRADLNLRLLCPDCKNDPPNLVEEFASGDLVCGDCGLVVGDKIIDTRSECEYTA